MLYTRISDSESVASTKKPDGYLVPTKTAIAQEVDTEGVRDPLSVKLVSPVKQTNDQGTSEIRRESNDIDRKGGSQRLKGRTMKKRQKKGGKRSSNSSHKRRTKTNRVNKRKGRKTKTAKKRRIRDIFTL